jgi:hypothetical protein
MAERRMSDLFECSVDTYWSKLFFDEAYNRALFEGALKFESWKLIRSEDSEKTITRVVDAVPRVGDLPGPIKRLIKNGAGYREDSLFDKATQRCTATVHPASLADRLTIKGVTFTERVSDKQCNRVFLANVKADIFAVGGMLETLILDNLEKSYRKAARFSNQWIAEKGL